MPLVMQKLIVDSQFVLRDILEDTEAFIVEVKVIEIFLAASLSGSPIPINQWIKKRYKIGCIYIIDHYEYSYLRKKEAKFEIISGVAFYGECHKFKKFGETFLEPKQKYPEIPQCRQLIVTTHGILYERLKPNKLLSCITVCGTIITS